MRSNRLSYAPWAAPNATTAPRRLGGRGQIYADRAMVAPFPAYLPSPSANGLSIGPLRLHVYGLLIAVAIAAAIWLSQRRWEQIGGARAPWRPSPSGGSRAA